MSMVVNRPTANCGRHSLTISDVSIFFMSPRNLLVRLDVSQRADVIALRDGLGQLKACVEAAADAVVAAHGDVAEPGDLLVAAAGLLPGLDQRTVVEIEIERVIRILDEIHLEYPSGRAGEQRLSQTLEALGAALFLQVGALLQPLQRQIQLLRHLKQIGILLHSGISTTEGLHILCEESKTDTDREILKPLINSMEKNGSLSQALEDSGCFPKAMTAYIKTGEETGCLDEIMTSLSRHYDQEQEISQQIRSAVTYPLIMLGMMAVVILVLLVKVLPVFQQVFHQMGLEMNGISQGLLNAGNMISRYSAVFLILAVLLIGCILFFSLTEKGHAKLRKLVTHLPVFCEIPVAMDYSRLAQGLSLGLRSGLSPETSLELTEAMLTQPEILEKLRKTSELLNNGEAFSKALTESELFSGMEGRLISISFYSGTSDETFRRLSQQYTEKSIDLISQAVSVVEPTIVILLSLLVGLVLLSVMMPLLGILSDFAI